MVDCYTRSSFLGYIRFNGTLDYENDIRCQMGVVPRYSWFIFVVDLRYVPKWGAKAVIEDKSTSSAQVLGLEHG